jgi:ABC-2 type transport system permease protein
VNPSLLIASREFRTYVATASFWIALCLGPLMALGASLLLGHAAPPQPMRIESAAPELHAAAVAAVTEAAGLEDRRISLSKTSGPVLSIVARPDRSLDLKFAHDFPLSRGGRTLVARTLERDLMRQGGAVSPAVRLEAERAAAPKADPAGASRFLVVMVLWLTLTGSLGMLLQAVVRERSNRSLEMLLTSASPFHLVLGKLMGVGAVSLLVTATWLASVAAAASMSDGAATAALLREVTTPTALLHALAAYLLGFLFYGMATIAISAGARDNATAQNLSRPMFAVLLAVFFLCMGIGGGLGGLSWLVFIPPLTPFMLLMHPVALPTELTALALTMAASIGLARIATLRVRI